MDKYDPKMKSYIPYKFQTQDGVRALPTPEDKLAKSIFYQDLKLGKEIHHKVLMSPDRWN